MNKKLIILAGLIFSILGLTTYKVTHALFSNSAASTDNTFTAQSVFPSTSPSPTSSPKIENIFVSNSFTCSTGAAETTADKGDVTFAVSASDLFLTVTLIDATPNTPYDIWVNQDPGACPLSSPTFAGGVTTDGSGNKTESFITPRVSGATKFWVSAVAGIDVFRSIAVELP